MSGKLKIAPIKAQLTRDTELFLDMKPYVKIIIGK
jgi:hypothetical protein